MRLSIGEMSNLTGISIRTLRYYDEIGLLKPSIVSEAGYRYYDDEAARRLEQILFYRELDFSLRDIERILSSPSYDRRAAMRQHRAMLLLKRRRLDELIRLTEENLEGETTMALQQFNDTDIEKTRQAYAAEAEDKWGKTDAYEAYKRQTDAYAKADWEMAQAEMDELVRAFAARLDDDPAGDALQGLVEQWRQHITRRYYPCTKEILAGLGQMYVSDERFTKNLDRWGDGTASLISQAIGIYCLDKE